jgi:hypothetical protein
VALVHGFELDEDTAFDLLWKKYNPRCQPPWTEKELRHKVHDAATKRHDKPRGWLLDRPRAPTPSARSEPASPSEAVVAAPAILIDTDEHRVVDQSIAALSGDPDLYQRGGTLVRVVGRELAGVGSQGLGGGLKIVEVPGAHLRERLTARAALTKVNQRGETVRAHPPKWLVDAVGARGQWPGVRSLIAISDVPILRADGTVCQTPGYDPRSRVFYEPAGPIPAIPEHPSEEDVARSLDAILEVIEDFQFENDVDKAAFLAALLTPLARHAFTGPAPLFLFDANVRGAGKSLLAQIVGRIVLGREMPVSSYSHDSEEMRKKITAIALAGDPMVLLDNLEGKFGNGVLDRVLTATSWSDRVLGVSKIIDARLLTVWYATGNNVTLGADSVRRVIQIRLDVLDENPEVRTGFKHPRLAQWVSSQQGRLLAAGLTILVGYVRAGRPNQGLAPMGSFEGWSELVRNAVVWAGLPDVRETQKRLAQHADSGLQALAQLLRAWQLIDPAGHGIVISELIARLYADPAGTPPSDEAAAAMRAALENMVGTFQGRGPTARQVGNKLKGLRRRVHEERFLDTNPREDTRNGALWRLHLKS